MEVTREPNAEDRARLQEIAREFLGMGAIANFMNARTTGVKGDSPHYGYAVVATYPGLWSEGKLTIDYEQVAAFSQAVSSELDSSGNVTIDVTNPFTR